MSDFNAEKVDELDKNEIAEWAAWAAHTIARTYREMGVKFSSLDEKFVAQCFGILMEDCEKGTTIDSGNVMKRVSDFDDFKNKRISKVAKQEVLIFAERFPKMLASYSPSANFQKKFSASYCNF